MFKFDVIIAMMADRLNGLEIFSRDARPVRKSFAGSDD
jgi:hypothetical protein